MLKFKRKLKKIENEKEYGLTPKMFFLIKCKCPESLVL